jgi:hypothetical protein
MVYYFHIFLGVELVALTYTNFEQCEIDAIKYGIGKFRDTLGGEYFIN